MKIGIHGINGKMGLAIAHEIMAHPDLELGAASVRNGHEWAGKRLCDVAPDLPDCTVRITSNLDQFCAAVDVVVDFTRPDATLAILPVCQKLKKPLMIGTTGFNQDATAWIHRAAQHIPLVLAANTSLGVNILFEVSRRVAEVLDFQHWDVDILEAHHRNKVDAPSGTALRLGEMIAAALGDGSAYGLRIHYSREPEEGLETAGGIIQALPLLGEAPFLVVNADVWCDADLRRFRENRPPDSLAHLLLAPTPAWKARGDFSLAGQMLIAGETLTFTGISVLHPRLFAGVAPGFRPLAPILREHLPRGELSGEEHGGIWQDIGTPERLAALQAQYD